MIRGSFNQKVAQRYVSGRKGFFGCKIQQRDQFRQHQFQVYLKMEADFQIFGVLVCTTSDKKITKG
jgi:hypothetical protein